MLEFTEKKEASQTMIILQTSLKMSWKNSVYSLKVYHVCNKCGRMSPSINQLISLHVKWSDF